MDRERVDGWLERVILGLVLGILVYGPLAFGAVRIFDQLLILGLLGAATLVWIARLWLRAEHRFLWPPICWAVLLFAGYALARYASADIEYVARLELIRVLAYALLFFVVLNNLHRQESMQLIGMVLVCLATVISMYGLYQFITQSDRVWNYPKPPQYWKRGSGTYICPNHLAGFLEMVLPLGLAYTLVGRFSPTVKVFLGYATLVILAAIGATVSRGGWVVTGVCLGLFFLVLLRYREHRIAAVAGLIILIGAATLLIRQIPYSKARFEQLFASERAEENFRIMLWPVALNIWRDHFWWGGGPGHFDFLFRQHRPKPIQWRPERVHNDYLNTLADWGLIGFSLVLACWVALGMGAVRTWKFVNRSPKDLAVKRSNRTALFLGAILGLVAILLHSVVDFNMHIPANAALAVTLMAVVTAHLRFATDRFWVTLGRPARACWSGALVVAVVYFVGQSWRLARQEIALARASDFPRYSKARTAALERAYQAEPMNADTTYQIGEGYRAASWEGTPEYARLAREAMRWFARGIELNPFDARNPLRYGMCLDWLDRPGDAKPYFEKVRQLDPNSYFMAAHIGWHHFQLGDYAGAKRWFEFSLELKPYFNDMAVIYLRFIQQKMAE